MKQNTNRSSFSSILLPGIRAYTKPIQSLYKGLYRNRKWKASIFSLWVQPGEWGEQALRSSQTGYVTPLTFVIRRLFETSIRIRAPNPTGQYPTIQTVFRSE